MARNDLRQRLELAGDWARKAPGGDLRDSIERPMVEGAWVVPDEIAVNERPEGSVLTWSVSPSHASARLPGARYGTPVRGYSVSKRDTDNHVLWRLVRLGSGPPQHVPRRVREYAESFGVLDLCRHFGVPRRECHLEDERASHGHADPLRGEELVEDWLMWSRMLEAFLGLHVSVNAGNNGDPGRWACLLGSLSGRAAEAGESSRLSQRVEGEWFLSRQRLALLDPDTSFEDWHAALTLGEATRLLEFWVNLMLRAGRVSPRVRLTDHDEPRFELAAPDTFGAIARQLAGVAASIPSIKLCRGCGLTFAPDRGNQKWCHECKKNRVDFKLRQRAYRAR